MELENIISNPPEFYISAEEKDEEERKKRHYSLLRSCSLQERTGEFIFPALSCRRRSMERVMGVYARPGAKPTSRETICNENENKNQDEEMICEDESESNAAPVTQTRRATISSGSGNSFFKTRLSNLHDWPLGEPKINNDDNYFNLELNCGQFKSEEISARVVGKDLIVHCKANLHFHRDEPIPDEIFRCYPLPLSVAPISSDVWIEKDKGSIRMTVRKESQLRSPIALFAPDIHEILEEEQASDDEEEENRVRMDD